MSKSTQNAQLHLMSPAPDVLSHNRVPTAAEVQAIQDAVTHAETRMTLLNAELLRVTTAMEDVQTFINQHKGAVSPLRRLPNEIIGEIMKHCVPNYNPYLPERGALHRAVLVLTSICSRWRSVAISTPQFWRVITWFGVDTDLPLMELMLSRSGDCSLELHARHKSQRDILLDVMRLHFHQLDVLDDAADMIQTGALISGPPLARLRTLNIGIYSGTNDVLKLLGHCPGVEIVHIALRGRQMEFSMPSPVEMPRLWELSVECDSTDLHHFFGSIIAPNLSEFQTCFTPDNFDWPQASFIDLLSRSKASLKSIEFAYTPITVEGFSELLDAVPDVEEIHLQDDNIPFLKVLYRYLTVSTGEIIPSPKLATLLIRCDAEYMAPTRLMSMILSRVKESPLKRLILIFNDNDDDSIAAHFASGSFGKLRKRADQLGLTLEVKGEYEELVNVMDIEEVSDSDFDEDDDSESDSSDFP